jgi:mannose-6-phosphate isomerase
MESEILNGKYKGQLFRTYFDENKARFGLSQYKELPFLLALVDATDDLSLQVHPSDEMAKKLENADFGKNESWYFIETPKSGKIFDGCKAKTSEELRQKVEQGKYDEVIDYLDVKPEDYVYIEAGTMHAMAAGSLVFEIEENCNATYRVYDFDRIDKDGKKRPLQTENALNSIIVENKSKVEKYSKCSEKHERLYSTKLVKNATEYKNKTKTIECLTFLSGENILDGCKIQKGVTVVLEPNEGISINSSDFIVSRALVEEDK